MDKNELVEKRSRLAELPVLQDNLKKLETEINKNEVDAELLFNKYQDKANIRDSLRKDFLYSAVMKIKGKYNSEIVRLTEDMENTRLEYNKLVVRVKALNAEYEDLKSRILLLNQEKSVFIEEMRRREEMLNKSENSEILVQYRQLKSDQKLLSTQITQIDEIIEIAKRAINTANRTIHSINMSNIAKNKVQYENIRRKMGGFIPVTPGYKPIDRSGEYVDRIRLQIKDLIKMITDVRTFENSPYRSVFGSIVAQLNKMEVIIKDCDYIRKLRLIIEETVEILEKIKSKIQEQLYNIEARIYELIILV